jgi:hypothetical protein
MSKLYSSKSILNGLRRLLLPSKIKLSKRVPWINYSGPGLWDPSLKKLLTKNCFYSIESASTLNLLGTFEIKPGNILRYRSRPRQCGWMKNRVKNLLALSMKETVSSLWVGEHELVRIEKM